ncbi:unnamed protein product [Orchesella dallaii]|uniref:Uncharacterized protein n=1 Tax=Orchesella dallaii TaxID=48710 RepID=A0ABP1QKP8_9HEXA
MVKARETGTSPEVASTSNESQTGGGNDVGFMATNTSTLAVKKEEAPETNGVEKVDQSGDGDTINGIPSRRMSSSFRGSRGGGRGSRSRNRVGKPHSSRGRAVASSPDWCRQEDFMQMISLHSTVPHSTMPHSLLTPEPNVNPFFPPHSTPPQYMSRERFLQLSAHLNNATVCVSHAFQLIRHAEIELQLTRQGLHACYEGQGQSNVNQTNCNANANTDATETNSDENAPAPIPSNESCRVDNDALAESWNNGSIGITTEMVQDENVNMVSVPNASNPMIVSSAEQIQLHVDPYRIVEPPPHDLLANDSSISEIPKAGKSSRNRGNGNGGRRKRGSFLSQQSRRKASKTEMFPSNYNLVMAKKSVEELRIHCSNSHNNDKNALENGRFMTVKVDDIGNILKEKEVELSPSVFSAAKVESSLKKQNEPEPITITPVTALIEDSDNRNTTDEDSNDDLFEVSKKQVRKKSKSSFEELKTDTGRKRKLASSSSEQNEDQIPLWRQLRVDEELSQKIKNRVLKDLEVRRCVKTDVTIHDADTASDASSAETEIIPRRPLSISYHKTGERQ